MSKLATVTVELDNHTHEWLLRQASAQALPIEAALQQALQAYVTSEEKREAFLQESMAAWKDFERTGLHVTAEEADEWLAKLEAGIDVDPLKCHV